jgi:transposase-like protein
MLKTRTYNTKLSCTACGNDKLEPAGSYQTTQNGTRKMYHCTRCQQIFSETKGTFLEGLQKPVSLISQVLKSRSEGLSLNATCRVFDIAKNTLLNFERRFSALKDILMVYTLLHTFINQIVEGDELYTKVSRNVPVEECEGWTIVLMERASRFIWEMKCGKKDRTLFLYGIRMIKQVVDRTLDVTLVTDGERRYGKILFEICHEVIRSGAKGRPPKVLREGLKVRLKNKGSQRSKKKRPKYEAPQPEHPQTGQNIQNHEIHANHVEAFNASLRRRNSAFRRRCNTYAKNVDGLQRTLNLFWIVHNFIRVHYTTKKVPSVELGILNRGLHWEEIFMMQKTNPYFH